MTLHATPGDEIRANNRIQYLNDQGQLVGENLQVRTILELAGVLTQGHRRRHRRHI